MEKFKLSAIGQVAVNVYDLDRATLFYRDVLGLHFLFQTPIMSFFDCDGVMLMLGTPRSPEDDHPSSILYFQVQDIQFAYQKLAGRGVEFLQGPEFVASMEEQDLWMAFFKDTEGNVMALRALLPSEK